MRRQLRRDIGLLELWAVGSTSILVESPRSLASVARPFAFLDPSGKTVREILP